MSFPTNLPASAFPELPVDPPAAHEDLTIAETLETMRVNAEHRPGEHCFLNEDGQERWIHDAEFGDFVGRYGAEHPSNYLAKYGVDWKQIFFKTNS
jgi:hypothetical protein